MRISEVIIRNAPAAGEKMGGFDSARQSPVSLRELDTLPKFDTSTHEVLEAFYVPALRRSISYDRGVGFFTSSWMRLAAAGLAGLAANGGKARIVASPKLQKYDVQALTEGADAKGDETLREALLKDVTELGEALERETLTAIAWMVADGILEFRVALPAAGLDGDFHDKFGVFRDVAGNAVAFHGSPHDNRDWSVSKF